MKIIGFLSDFGLSDNFIGVVKAVILGINPYVQIVDICHNIAPHDIIGASLLLKSSFRFFPPGSIFLAVVDPGVGTERKKIIVKTEGYYFVGPDNGLFSLVLEQEPPLKIVEITNQRYFLRHISSTFHGRDIFAPIVGYLSKGYTLNKFGEEINLYQKIRFPLPKVKGDILEGEIVYIDRFGNLVTNIDEKTFWNFVKNKKFKIRIKDFVIERVSNNYQEIKTQDKPFVLFNSFGYLEVALKEKSAALTLKLDRKSKIEVIRI